MNFRASFYNPFKPHPLEIGALAEDKIIETFEKIPWAEYLKKMEGKSEDLIHYSPSFEIENKVTKNKLTISAVSTASAIEYFIFYKHAKKVKSFFGLSEKIKENYLSEVSKQTHQDVINCLQALIQNDSVFLENKFS